MYKINEETALVQTLDFFTPIVDDPYEFGQIAAANSLSDVYAMGGRPITVMNIVAFPINTIDPDILAKILAGASDKVSESGAVLVGGHSIDDPEPKFGLSVTGTVHPSKIRANAGAKPGDKLILTKPIGVGIQTTAIKRDLLDEEAIARVSKVMATLNKYAAEVMEDFDVRACTDITGFGLLGHALEMAEGSKYTFQIHADSVPVLPGTKELAEQNVIPGGTKKNHKWIADRVEYAEHISELDQFILCDAVTSGGLLIAVAGDEADDLHALLLSAGVEAAVIGEVVDDQSGKLFVK